MSCEFFKRLKVPAIRFTAVSMSVIPIILAANYLNRGENNSGYLCIEWAFLGIGMFIAGYALGLEVPCGLVHTPENIELQQIEGEPNPVPDPEINYLNYGA
jgi:uncharacterized membrane protein YczE